MFPWAIWKFGFSRDFSQDINRRVLLWSVLMACISMATGLTWYVSLPLTSVSSNTAIYNSSCVVVFILSFFLLAEVATIYKLISVLVCVGGILIVSFLGSNSAGSSKSSTPVGLLMVTLSMVLYAVFEVFYSLFTKRQASTSTNLLNLGLMGLCTAFLLWPVVVIVHYTGYETFELPVGTDLEVAVVNLLLDLVLNASLLVGVHISSPLFMSVGSQLTIPASILADKIFHNILPPKRVYVGMVMIVVGFLGLNLSEQIEFFRNTRFRYTFRCCGGEEDDTTSNNHDPHDHHHHHDDHHRHHHHQPHQHVETNKILN
eukprot:TRINITY_DN2484_c0_g1_i5.p1 TRINITY_DN2484_c0_g1~~TRINITY_DN2484_c0_g1_i5.p1  ORF type:complete len:316 (+),score=40.16 TRINITY_DN2484_c0_g1_i5:390-1337(+)